MERAKLTDQELAEKAVNSMLEGDNFSRWLGIKLLEAAPGRAVLSMKVRDEMLNGFSVLHGGIAFSLADSAVAFASNSAGKINLSIENSISYLMKSSGGDTLTARAQEVSQGSRTAVYYAEIRNQNNDVVALFKGTVFKTEKEFVSKGL